MTSYKFTYFPLRGLGEFIRLIFHYSKVPFEDNRVSFEDWPNLKTNTPFGKLPILEVDGKVLAESFAIARFVARKHGLAGLDDWEAAQIDALADYYKDFGRETQDYIMILAGRSEEDKETCFKEKFIPAVEKNFPVLIRYLKESGSGFFFKSGVSWVDFFIANTVLSLNGFHPELFEKYKELKEHCDRVHSLPQLKNYLEKREKTPF